MKGHFIVGRLNKAGNYLSPLDCHPAYVSKYNPDGLMKMLITPILNSEGHREIRYIKARDGYLVSGEAHVITGTTETEIDRKSKHYKERWQNVTHTECKSENELW